MSDLLVVIEESVLTEQVVTADVLEVPTTPEVLVESVDQTTVLIEQVSSQLLQTDTVVEVLIEAITGPQGIPGISEDSMKYSKRVDFISDDVFYKGEAAPGTLESDAAWRVSKTVISTDSDVTETWAAGSAEFIQTWDNRASYKYS